MNIFANVLKAWPGKSVPIKAGKNVLFNESDLSFYAITEGQVCINNRAIQIHSIYEVNETLSMKTGNLDFIGSIVIKGNVPSGYTVKAEGDIKISGMVESATVIAGGSIYISEGFAGMKKGSIKAKANIHIGYINQGISQAGDSIYVENSIIHSECTARNHIFYQQGNIIGGSLSAGKSVEAKDIGNRLSTKTNINLGFNKKLADNYTSLITEKKELEATLSKLRVIGEKLKGEQNQIDARMRITLLRQRNSYQKVSAQIEEINNHIQQTNAYLECEEEAKLMVRNKIYSNVIIAFGKYKHKMDNTRNHVQMKLKKSDVVIYPLAD